MPIRVRNLLCTTALPAFLLTGCSGSDRATFGTLRELAGPGATNCGRASTVQALRATNQCVFDADRQHMPFFVRYQANGDDSVMTFGLARARDGHLFKTSIDHDPNGGNRDSLLFNRGSISVRPCASSNVAVSRGMLTCDP